MSEQLEVRWFSGRSTIGVVRVVDPYDGPKYYIGPGQGISEEADTKMIRDWGTRFPNDAGDVLFGIKKE